MLALNCSVALVSGVGIFDVEGSALINVTLEMNFAIMSCHKNTFYCLKYLIPIFIIHFAFYYFCDKIEINECTTARSLWHQTMRK